MPTAKVYNLQGEVVGEQPLADSVFGAPVNMAVLHQVVTSQLWNRRQGNASTLTRAQVSGGNSKPYRQKGTGRARQGSTRAPHFRHGGNVFGPRPHKYHVQVNRKMRRIALRSALSDKAANDRILILKDFVMDAPHTKTMVEFFKALNLQDDVHTEANALVILAERDENLVLSLRNIKRVKVGHVASPNVVEYMKHDYLLLTPEALAVLEATFDDGLIVTDEEAEAEI